MADFAPRETPVEHLGDHPLLRGELLGRDNPFHDLIRLDIAQHVREEIRDSAALRTILLKAADVAEAASRALVTVDPHDAPRIIRLQNEVKRCLDIAGWLQDELRVANAADEADAHEKRMTETADPNSAQEPYDA